MANTKAVFIAENASSSTLVPSTTAADYIEIPITSENVGATAQSTASQTIRNDRQPSGAIRTGIQVAGAISAEFAYGAYDAPLQWALLSAAWANVNGSAVKSTGNTITLDHSTKNITASSGTPFAGLAVGDWVRLEKSGYQNDMIAVRISTFTSSTDINYDSWTKTPTTDGSGVASVTVRSGQSIEIGTTDYLLTLAKKIAQAGVTKYPAYLGLAADGLQLSLQPGQVPSLQIPFVGSSLVGDDDGDFRLDSDGNEVGSGGTNIVLSTYLASGYTAAPSNSVFSPVQQSSSLMVDGVPSSLLTQFQMALANNTAGEPVLFRFGNYGVSAGAAAISGSFEAIYTDGSLRTAFRNETPIRLALYIVDGTGQAYIIDMPRVLLNGGNDAITSAGGFVKLPFQFSAEKDSTTSRALQIIRLGIA